MEFSQDNPQISDSSFHLSKRPPEMIKSTWPSKFSFRCSKPFPKSLKTEEEDAGKKADTAPRKKKFSISRKRLKYQSDMTLGYEKGTGQTADIFKIILTKLTIRAKHSLKIITDKIKRKRFTNDYRNLKNYHYDLINDPCSAPPNSNQPERGIFLILPINIYYMLAWFLRTMTSQAISIFKGKFACSFKKSITNIKYTRFNPNSTLKVTWDFFIVLLTVIQLFYFSIEKSFFVDLKNTNYEISLLLAFYLDLIVSMNTKFFKEGAPVTDRMKILKNILTRKFHTDLAPFFSLTLIIFLGAQPYEYLNIILIGKLMKARKLCHRFKELVIRTQKVDALYHLGILILKIIVWAHLIAVLWHFVGISTSRLKPEANNWLRAKGIENKDWKTKYLFSVYWGVTTMLTVGYGDITPTNSEEVLFNIIAMFFGCGMFGYSMNKIGQILSRYHKKNNYLNKQMSKVGFMLQKKKLPHETQNKIKRYLEFVWKQEQREDPEEENFIMSKLNSELRNEIYLHTNVKYLKVVPAFKNFSEKTLILLARCMRKVCFSPEEFVYKEGDSDSINLFFILDGNLSMVSARDDKIMTVWRKLKNEDFFGEGEIFSGNPRSLSVISTNFSTLFKLSRFDVIQVLKKIPHEYEKFCQMRDLELLYNEYSQYNQPCLSCGFNDHPLNECSLLKYNPNKRMILNVYQIRTRKRMKRYRRKVLYSHNAFHNRNEILSSQTDFLTTYKDDDDLKDLINLYSLEEDSKNCYTSTYKEFESKDVIDNEAFPSSKELFTWRVKGIWVTGKPQEISSARSPRRFKRR